MAVTLTYDSQLSRVRVEADGLGDALVATVERSTDQVSWTTVRGGSAVTVVAGEIAVDDYEFASDVANYYRVTYLDTITYVGAGTADHDDNAAVTPGLPAGLAEGDVLIELTAIRNSGTGTCDTPAGYEALVDFGNLAVRGKVASASESTPTQSFTGGVAGASTSAQLAAFRGCSTEVGEVATLLNASMQHIVSPGLTPSRDNSVIVWVGWKQDDWTSVTVPGAPVVTEIGEPDTDLGDDQGIAWGYLVQAEGEFVGAASFQVTGGASAISRAVTFELFANEVSQTNSITPTLGQVWLKFIARPFLNTAVDAFGEVVITRRARNAVYPVVGRSAPIGVTDVRAGREVAVAVKTLTAEDTTRLDLALAGGDPVFLHCPADSPLPTMYAVIGDTTDEQPVPGVHFWRLPLTEVAAPAAEIVGATITWQGVINQYATWQDVIDGETTWQDLLTNIGDPSDVITS